MFATLPWWVNSLLILISMVLIAKGAAWVVESATALSRRFGISELIIGLTVVALGTSAPEFAVTLIAAFQERGNISIGNIVGSNIFNLGFILGGCAMVRAIPSARDLVYRDGAVLIGTTVLLTLMIGWDLKLDRWDGVVLFLIFITYLGYLYRQRKVISEVPDTITAAEQPSSLSRETVLLFLGLAAVVGGSYLLVESASAIARSLGVSEWVIGVTIVAAGTSMPELATSLMAVTKGRYALSMGNIIGSDIFNLLGVLSLTGMIHPVTVDPSARISLLALCAFVILTVALMRSNWMLTRREGALLFAVALLRWYFDFSSH